MPVPPESCRLLFLYFFKTSSTLKFHSDTKNTHIMVDHLGADMRKTRDDDKKKDDKPIAALDEGDIALLKMYGKGPYSDQIKQIDADIQELVKKVNDLNGVRESDTGLANPALWDLQADKQALQSEQPLQVARCTKIINPDSNDPKYSEFGIGFHRDKSEFLFYFIFRAEAYAGYRPLAYWWCFPVIIDFESRYLSRFRLFSFFPRVSRCLPLPNALST